jgi:hypothetical protein
MSSRNAFIPSMLVPCASIDSAYLAAVGVLDHAGVLDQQIVEASALQ